MPSEIPADPLVRDDKAVVAPAFADGLWQAVDVDTLAEMLQARGFRAERVADDDGRMLLRSATGGIAFHLRPGNPAGNDNFLDFGYFAVLQLTDSPPAAAINDWNASKRFARVHVREHWVILEMDVLVAGGVSGSYLAATLEVWDRLLHDLVAHLRNMPALA